KTPAEAAALIGELRPMVAECSASDILLCVPFVDIDAAIKAACGSNIGIGAENVHFAGHGAFTGEISASMLTEIGVKYVIVGHSERRQYFGETDETVNLRARAALDAGMKPIVCVGETLAQRDLGITAETVSLQTKIALSGVPAEQMSGVVIAYEPVWAIGTGRTATTAQAQEVCALIRDVIRGLYGDPVADVAVILYGGSMNAANAADLLAEPDVDGGLIGGASLKPVDFTVIAKAAEA
ncbi:MAG: triose-phosphate isomerase, partial [Clostridiales bacterium]|nr:triose-phosphate isomerase [Clostridiales bacterium]